MSWRDAETSNHIKWLEKDPFLLCAFTDMEGSRVEVEMKTDPSLTHHVWDGLDPHSSYIFKVTARTAAGEGPAITRKGTTLLDGGALSFAWIANILNLFSSFFNLNAYHSSPVFARVKTWKRFPHIVLLCHFYALLSNFPLYPFICLSHLSSILVPVTLSYQFLQPTSPVKKEKHISTWAGFQENDTGTTASSSATWGRTVRGRWRGETEGRKVHKHVCLETNSGHKLTWDKCR